VTKGEGRLGTIVPASPRATPRKDVQVRPHECGGHGREIASQLRFVAAIRSAANQ
jgi:hypothetical protein